MINVRELSINDALVMNKWHNNKELFSFLVGNFYGPSLDETKKWISEYEKHINHSFRGIVSNEKSEDIGAVYLIDNNKPNEAEVGIFIANETDRGKGYGYQMLGWLINFGFNVLKLDRIVLWALEDNEHAIKLYEKFGFSFDSSLDKVVKKDEERKIAKYMFLMKGNYNG